ncbi:hypothetical protein JNB11_00150 [Kocuria palustris]|nr:hypothetical protein [Kocuria palustris]
MRFGLLQLVFLVVLAAFTFALPVQTVEEDTQLTFLNELFARDIGMEIPRDVEENWALVQRGIEEGYYDVDVLAKREVKVLTDLFLSMNKTGAGVQLIKGFATNPLTQLTTIQAVVSFIKTQDLGELLKAAADSGLATDIVLMLFTHMEAFKGLVQVGKALFTQGIIKFKRDAFMKRDEFSKRDFFGTIWNGIQNIFGWGSSSSSGSTQQQSTPTATATAQQQQQQTQQTQQGATPPPTPAPPRSSQTGTVPAIVLSGSAVTSLGELKITASAVPAQGSVSLGISVAAPNSASVAQQAGELATAAGVNTNAPLPTFDANAIPTGELAAADAIKMFNQLQGNNPAPVSVTNTAGQITYVQPAGIFGGIIGGIISGVGDVVNGVGQVVGGVVSGVGNVVGGVVSGVGGVVSGIFDGVGQAVSGVVGTLMGILDNAQQALFTGLLNAINLAGSFEDICVSLQKSGFGVLVAYSLFADNEMHDFDLKTVKAAIDQDALTLLRILSAASSLGIVTKVITDLFSSSKNSSITFSFFVQVLFNFKSIFFS